MTNAEKIRAMTDEEFALYFAGVHCPYVFGWNGRCMLSNDENAGCKSCWLRYMKQEVTQDVHSV